MTDDELLLGPASLDMDGPFCFICNCDGELLLMDGQWVCEKCLDSLSPEVEPCNIS